MIDWQADSRIKGILWGGVIVGLISGAIYFGGMAYDNINLRFEFTPRPRAAAGDCGQSLPEAKEHAEIGRLLRLGEAKNCTVHRKTIHPGELLSKGGSYLAVVVEEGKQKAGEAAVASSSLESWKKSLSGSGWREDEQTNGPRDHFHAAFRRELEDQSRQYLSVHIDQTIQIALLSLPTSRVEFRLPKPATFVSHVVHAKNENFAELPPPPGLLLTGAGHSQSSWSIKPTNPALSASRKLAEYTWIARTWERTYRYDSAALPPAAMTRLYSDALREAGWQINWNHGVKQAADGLSASFHSSGDRELHASVVFGQDEAKISLTDLGFQKKVADIFQQWKADCVAEISGLKFSPGESALSKEALAALEILLEARLAAIERREFGNDPRPLILELRGHADPSGGRRANSDLALARANVVKTWLIARGVPDEYLGVSTYGDWPDDTGMETTPGREVTVAQLPCEPVERETKRKRSAGR